MLQYSGGGAVTLHPSRGTANVLQYSGGGAATLEVMQICYNILEVGWGCKPVAVHYFRSI